MNLPLRSKLNCPGANTVMGFLSDGTELIQRDLLCGMSELSLFVARPRTKASHLKAHCSYFS